MPVRANKEDYYKGDHVRYIGMFLLLFANIAILSKEPVEGEKYLICDLEDHCCEIDSSVMGGLEWKFGAKQFFKCTLSYFFGVNEEDYNECRRMVGNEFWTALEEHVNEVCDFSITQ